LANKVVYILRLLCGGTLNYYFRTLAPTSMQNCKLWPYYNIDVKRQIVLAFLSVKLNQTDLVQSCITVFLYLRHVSVKSDEIGSLLHSHSTALSAVCNTEPCRHGCR